jgi:hypothetical protein
MKKISNKQSGQTIIILLFITIIGMTIIAATTMSIFQNMQASSVIEQGTDAYYVAESGIQEALVRMLRDPNYSGTPVGQPLSIGGGTVVISTSSGGIITAIGTYNNSVRKIQIKTVYNNGVITIQSWKEI